MTVSSSTSKVQYNGNGSTTVFAYTFKIFDQDDLTVIIRSANGTETTQTITTHYTVSGVGADGGGNVTMLTAPASGETITILREQPLTQGLDLVPNDPFPANSIEDALDKLTFMVQSHSEELDRAIKASRTNTITSTEFTVSASDRANKVFAFDGSGELSVAQELGTYRGNWAASTAFAARDIVKDTSNNNIYICVTAHTSSGSQPISSNADVAKWALLVDAASATTSATNAAASASAAATSATNAANSATAAAASQSAAATSASNASTSETNAASSATNASNSATAAAASETAAGTSETNAASSATAAASSASAAATSASNASTSETNAASSASTASTAATTATTQATAAAASATAAAASESAAATSETNAATSATNAATSATAAAASQTAAAASAAAAANSYDAFDDRYLGTKTSDPTVDNDGNPLVAGALYFNTTANEMRVYDGGNWIPASSAGNVSLLNYNYTATGGQTTFSGADDNAATLSYTQQNLIVTLNGVVLEDGTDYTANDGTSIVLAVAASAGDELNIVAFKSFTTADMVPASTGGTFSGNVAINGDLTVDTSTLFVDSTNNRVGIGTSSPSKRIHISTGSSGGSPTSLANTVIESSGETGLNILTPATTTGWVTFGDNANASIGRVGYSHTDNALLLYTAATERMRLDASGNLLVGKTSQDQDVIGAEIRENGIAAFTASGTAPLRSNRKTSDGNILIFQKDGTTVGSIGVVSGNAFFSGVNLGMRPAATGVVPVNASGASADNAYDIGQAAVRWDDIYATNGTIQTSDRNEKQDIAELDEAERRVAVAAKGLLRKFRWKDAVAEKGDEARIHFGIIAQDLQAAFAAEGLDAGRYAMFISSTWWEADRVIPAVEAQDAVYETQLDEDGNEVQVLVSEAVEAQPEQVVTDTYETQAEAPEGAVERTRLGVRYPELLAFIIGAM